MQTSRVQLHLSELLVWRPEFMPLRFRMISLPREFCITVPECRAKSCSRAARQQPVGINEELLVHGHVFSRHVLAGLVRAGFVAAERPGDGGRYGDRGCPS
jgi:hypothetical protein